ncbi:MAG: hypothetical protein ACI93R_000130 [Flavobacteriales bacterium]|jgi:hypothetical protein
MLKALAEYVMRGRFQAISVALLGSFFSLVSQAVIGLVTMRKGWLEGLLVTLWACLPPVLGVWLGDVPSSMVVASVGVLIINYLLSVILRYSGSWALALFAAVTLSSIVAFLIASFVVDLAVQTEGFFEGLMATPENADLDDTVLTLMQGWTTIRSSGLFAYWICLTTLLGMFVARWWQAQLYNPGGFQQEFHSLRLPVVMALVCMLAFGYCQSVGAEYDFWAGLFSLPLLVSGLGLLHQFIARYKLGVGGVISLYVILPFVSWVVIALAAIDSVIDLRKFLRFNQSS